MEYTASEILLLDQSEFPKFVRNKFNHLPLNWEPLRFRLLAFSPLLLLALLLAVASPAAAQKHKFVSYSLEEGLSSTQVTAIIQDRSGYLWIGTHIGLNRFDGYTFKTNFPNEALLRNHINALLEDQQGRIWIGGPSGVGFLMDDRYVSIAPPTGIEKLAVRTFVEDSKGQIWMGTDQAGVLVYNGSELIQYTTENGLADNTVRALIIDENDQVVAGTTNGLSLLEGDHFVPISGEGVNPTSVTQIISDRDGGFWISTFSQGLFHFLDGRFENFTLEDNGLISNWIRSITLDSQNRIWCATKQGVTLFDGQKSKNFDARNGLSITTVNVVIQDQENNLWFGSDGGGILRFNNPAIANFTQDDGLSGNIIMSVLQDANGGYWFSSYRNGLTHIVDDEITRYDNLSGLNNNSMWGSFRDGKGHLWFGTSDGVTRFDGTNFVTYSLREGLPSQRVYAIAEDEQGQIWLGTKNGVAILKDGKFTNIAEGGGSSFDRVRHLHKDQRGNMWLATSNGVFSYDGRSFRHFTTDDGLSNVSVMSIAEDWSGNLWFGTDDGLTLYDQRTMIGVKVGEEPSQNLTNFLVFDDNNQLWVGTQQGIFRFDVENYYKDGSINCRFFGLLEGLLGLETNQNAAYKDSDGILWFGTNKGVTNYDPSEDEVPVNPDFPKIYITDIRPLTTKIDWTAQSDGIDSLTGLPINLKFNSNQRYLNIDFLGISLTDPEKVQYQYRLIGASEEWVSLGTKRDEAFPILPYGDYTFEVRAFDKNQRVSPETASFSFTILPPFYLSGWFIGLCFLIAAMIGYLVVRWQTQISNRKKEQQQLILQSKMLGLEQQTLNTSMNRHFIFNALNSIQYYINRQDKLSANLYLANFAKLVRKNLDSTQTNLVSLSEELERLELYLSLEHMRFSDKFSYEIVVDDFVDREEIKIPSMLLQPFVENSIRHGILPMNREGRITIRIGNSNEQVVFAIEDNGIGINTSMANKNLDRKDHVSMGMEITEERLNLLRKMTEKDFRIVGPYELKDESGATQGTRVEIILPLEHNFYLE